MFVPNEGRTLETLHTSHSISAVHQPFYMSIFTRVKISQAITRLLAQQPCNNPVNMIEQD